MSSTDARRQRRRMKRDIIKNIQGQERNLKIPTEEDIQKYIDNMVKQIKIEEDGMQLQEQQGQTNSL